jgi:hypothetical protein
VIELEGAGTVEAGSQAYSKKQGGIHGYSSSLVARLAWQKNIPAEASWLCVPVFRQVCPLTEVPDQEVVGPMDQQ